MLGCMDLSTPFCTVMAAIPTVSVLGYISLKHDHLTIFSRRVHVLCPQYVHTLLWAYHKYGELLIGRLTTEILNDLTSWQIDGLKIVFVHYFRLQSQCFYSEMYIPVDCAAVGDSEGRSSGYENGQAGLQRISLQCTTWNAVQIPLGSENGSVSALCRGFSVTYFCISNVSSLCYSYLFNLFR